MTATTFARLLADLRRDEGLKLTVYYDTTGHATIGYGHKLTEAELDSGFFATGIDQVKATALLTEDADEAVRDVERYLPCFHQLDPVRQRVVANLSYNLGWLGLKKFGWTLNALERGDYDGAARHLQQSVWFTQVKTRGVRLVAMLRTGRDSDGTHPQDAHPVGERQPADG